MQNTATRRYPVATAQRSGAPAALVPADRTHRRNRPLAFLLAGIAILGFVIVIVLVVVLRYGQAHRLIAGF
jgi:hypothetical protein